MSLQNDNFFLNLTYESLQIINNRHIISGSFLIFSSIFINLSALGNSNTFEGMGGGIFLSTTNKYIYLNNCLFL